MNKFRLMRLSRVEMIDPSKDTTVKSIQRWIERLGHSSNAEWQQRFAVIPVECSDEAETDGLQIWRQALLDAFHDDMPMLAREYSDDWKFHSLLRLHWVSTDCQLGIPIVNTPDTQRFNESEVSIPVPVEQLLALFDETRPAAET